MPLPLFNPKLNPVKNLQLLCRAIGIAPLNSSVEQNIGQLLHAFAVRLGFPDLVTTLVATAGAATYTTQAFLNGLIRRDCAGGARSDTTPTAAQLIAGYPLTANYQERIVTIHNTSGTAVAVTLLGGVGVTLKGAITAEQGTVIEIGITRTSSTTVSIRQV